MAYGDGNKYGARSQNSKYDGISEGFDFSNRGNGEFGLNMPSSQLDSLTNRVMNDDQLSQLRLPGGEAFSTDIGGITPTLPETGNSLFGDFGFNQGTAQILKGIMDGISGYQLNNRRLEQLDLGRDQLNELKATNLFNQGLARQNAERQKTTVNNQIGAQQRVLAARRSATDPTKMGGAKNYEHLRLLT